MTTLVEGADFYSTPCVSPDGRQLAWLSWNHPNMPWDGTELYVAPIDADGTLGKSRHVAGGEDESIFQPAWSPDGTLYFVSDRTNWWNLYAERDGKVDGRAADGGRVRRAAMGIRHGDLRLSRRWPDRRPLHAGGKWRLALIDPAVGQASRISSLPYSNVSRSGGRHAIGLSPLVELADGAGVARGDRSGERQSDRAAQELADRGRPGVHVDPEAIEFPTDGGKTAHAFYYPPTNRDFRGPAGEKPPLLVMIHGGPTSATAATFRLPTQYWTSRGFAVCDVNYGGSTGYGREYRNRLRDNWGVVDVADATNAALYLAEQGKADRSEAADSRRQRRRLHDARLPGVRRRVPRRGEPLRHQRSALCWPRTRTNSSRAISIGWSVPIRRRRPAIASARRSIISTSSPSR